MDKKNKEIEISEPRMVKSHDVKLDAEYAEWIAEGEAPLSLCPSKGCR